jgi:hydrogenase nickel incorporation protein HypA/HybF
MHETGLLRAAVAELAAQTHGRAVRRVVLAVGPGADLDAARHAWAEAARDTPVAGAAVRWSTAQDELSCLDCGAGYAGDRLTVCPDCGGTGLVVEAAPELSIMDWSVDPTPPADSVG